MRYTLTGVPRVVKYTCAALVLGAAVSVLAGCLTSKRSTPRYAWETAQEETYTEPFRGRWWNFYDRGLWNQLRGDYEAALSDLQFAMAMRSRDQLWPRTYGMHFLPEYFPNRELGITLYHMAHYGEATQALEDSLRFQYSARSAYYLDEARRVILQRDGADVSAPDFELISPALDVPTGEIHTVLQGIATDDQYVAKVFVNNEPVDIRQSGARIPILHPIVLAAGKNVIEVQVIDLAGKSTFKRFEFEADLEGPVLSFDEYVASEGTLRGVAYDNVGVKTLEINGVEVPLTPSQNGLLEFQFTISPQMDVSYRCADVNGNVTEGTTRASRILQAIGVEIEPLIQVASSENDPSVLIDYLAQAVQGDVRFAAEFVNLEDEQRFFMDRITVNMEIISPVPIEAVSFNGRDISVIPARRYLRLSQSLGLGDDPISIDCILTARNDQGALAVDEKRIFRELNAVETEEGRLSLAFVELTNVHPRLREEEAEIALRELQDTRTFQKRFGRPVVRDQDMLTRMLQEQKLAQLSSDDHRLLGMQVVTADVLIGARISGTDDFIQIILDGYSSRINRVITDRVEVAGAFDDLSLLLDTLSTRLVQEFPRLQAPVIDIRGQDVAFALTSAHGIKKYFNCLLVERVEVVRGPFESIELVTRGDGLITKVRQENYSEADIVLSPEFDGSIDLRSEYDTYFIITK